MKTETYYRVEINNQGLFYNSDYNLSFRKLHKILNVSIKEEDCNNYCHNHYYKSYYWLKAPNLKYINYHYKFYFTEKGFKLFKKNNLKYVKLLYKNKDIRIKKINYINKKSKIAYRDKNQIAIFKGYNNIL